MNNINLNDPLDQSINIDNLINKLSEIKKDLLSMKINKAEYLKNYNPDYIESVQNLFYYLALRSQDIRFLQTQLSKVGLSSLGRTEFNVIESINSVLYLLKELKSNSCKAYDFNSFNYSKKNGEQLLDAHAKALLGAPPEGRDVRIMVTMPTEAAYDYNLVYNLLKNGMNCMRINCAHDNKDIWSKMIENLLKAKNAANMHCSIIMDLAGPKLRTGSIKEITSVIKITSKKNKFGAIIKPARIWLSKNGSLPPSYIKTDFFIPVERNWLNRLSKGDRVELKDSREAFRKLKIVGVFEEGCLAETKKTIYMTSGTILSLKDKNNDCNKFQITVKNLPLDETSIHLFEGDLLLLEKNLDYGSPSILNDAGEVINPPSISLNYPEIFDDINSGESIWFDDGKIRGIIENIEADKIYVRITHTKSGGGKLKGEKGINLPDSNLHLSAMTDKDIEDLRFIVANADIVALSFANSVKDVQLLRDHLNKISNKNLGVVLKIETQRGLKNLPSMLLEIMKFESCGIMIARGDLAVECGFEKMAEIQEEIICLCEAAHVPVIWATQVLETLAKEGIPSRAEITDAAMGEDAECVMLNKGRHILNAVYVLDNILKRMKSHKIRKRSMMRKLNLASKFREENSHYFNKDS